VVAAVADGDGDSGWAVAVVVVAVADGDDNSGRSCVEVTTAVAGCYWRLA